MDRVKPRNFLDLLKLLLKAAGENIEYGIIFSVKLRNSMDFQRKIWLDLDIPPKDQLS